MYRALWRVMIVMAMLAISAATAVAENFVTLAWEAEQATITGKVWSIRKKPEDPSGKVSEKLVLAVPRLGPGEHPARDEAVYKVKVPQDGVYYLWARTFWTNGCGNSIFMKVEGFDSGAWAIGGDGTYNVMHWVCLTDGGKNNANPRPLKLKKGTIAFSMGAKESATIIDQFLLTTDKKLTPANIYKATPDVLAKEEPKKDEKK